MHHSENMVTVQPWCLSAKQILCNSFKSFEYNYTHTAADRSTAHDWEESPGTEEYQTS